MNIYGFYSTDLVLRRPETSATDKLHFCSFDTPSLKCYLYFLNLHHIIKPADVSPNGNAIHTPVSPKPRTNPQR